MKKRETVPNNGKNEDKCKHTIQEVEYNEYTKIHTQKCRKCGKTTDTW